MIKKVARNDPCWCGSGKKYKKCHMEQDMFTKKHQAPINAPITLNHFVLKGNVSPKRPIPSNIICPDYAKTGGGEQKLLVRAELTNEELAQMRQTCHAARRVLDKGINAVQPGVTTDYIDSVVHEACIVEGGYPSPLNYHGFPKSVCTSVNEIICHGIPDDRPLKDGDIVNVDVTLFLNGFHGDCSETVPVGKIDQASHKLLTVTQESMMRGIAAIQPDGLIRDIGGVIEKYVKEHDFSVVRSYCGHGIGKLFHSDPSVPHYYDPNECTRIKPGMIFTVEPMVNMGTWKSKVWEDGWTAVTADLKRSAQFEHTILVTEDGVDILTMLNR